MPVPDPVDPDPAAPERTERAGRRERAERPEHAEHADVVVVGGGAAGLMAATWCGRTHPGRKIVVLEAARSPGAKILVAGGGRCNVTHDVIAEAAFNGSSPAAIRKVLRRYGVEDVVRFFAGLGVTLKREETGKLFPTTDRARSVLDALLRAVREAGAELRFPRRVERILAVPAQEAGPAPAPGNTAPPGSSVIPGIGRASGPSGFLISGDWGSLHASRVILCAGGRSLPKSGSDGSGFALAQALGHSLTPLVVPALVPLILHPDCRLRSLPGVATPAILEVQSGSGRVLARSHDAVLLTHFGLSGPAVLDVSRHYLHARAADVGSRLVACWLPGRTPGDVDRELLDQGRLGPARFLARFLPERLARVLCEMAGGDPSAPTASWTRETRRALVGLATAMVLPVAGDRGWTHAEVTAGGVPLSELRLETMESRLVPGLHLAGEILDVDGRIGGYNFQWAWASGHVAGCAA